VVSRGISLEATAHSVPTSIHQELGEICITSKMNSQVR